MTMPTLPRRVWRIALASALVLVGFAANAGTDPAEAQVLQLIQSCPYTIQAPGTYILTRDLDCPAPAITVAPDVDNVVLLLGGRTLTWNGEGDLDDGIIAIGTSKTRSNACGSAAARLPASTMASASRTRPEPGSWA